MYEDLFDYIIIVTGILHRKRNGLNLATVSLIIKFHFGEKCSPLYKSIHN